MNTFTLKLLALILMTLDHIALYFPAAPVWFGWLGRASYPLFLFCLAVGLRRTRSRGRYIARLYGMSVFMTLFGLALDHLFPTESGYGNHNIFVPMLLVTVLVSIWEWLPAAPRRAWAALGGLAAVQLAYFVLPALLPPLKMLSGDQLTGLLPCLGVHEYGFAFVALGVAVYLVQGDRRRLAAVYLLFCLYQFSAELIETGAAVQWLMVLALPAMLRYNGRRGPGGWLAKWGFYLYYPLHTAALFLLARGWGM